MPELPSPLLEDILEEILAYAALLPHSVIQATPTGHPRVGWCVSNLEDYREWSFTPERLTSLVKCSHANFRHPLFDFSTPEGRTLIAVTLHDYAAKLKATTSGDRESLWQHLLKD